MDNLPVELFDKIISNLTCPDLCSIRLTCKSLSYRATPLVFELLHLSARPTLLIQPIVGPLSLTHPQWDDRFGRSRSTSYCDLEEVVKIVQPIVAPLVKTLIFSPAWFREGLWYDDDHLQRLKIPNGPQDAWEGDEHRRPRPAYYESKKRKRDSEALSSQLEAKQLWDQLKEKQNDSRGNIRAAVAALISNMNRLENIILTDRTQLPDFMGIDLTPEDLYGWITKQQQSNTWRYFSVLARGLHAAARNIKTLAMYNLNACDLDACIATNHAFTGLTKLSLSISDNELILQNSSTPQAVSLTGFLEHTAPTLQYLSLNFSWENHRDYTKYAPSLGLVLARPIPNPSTETPLIFPQLLEIRLRMFSIETADLTKFLRHQPVLRKATFDALLLAAPNTTWNDVASALPRSVESWQVRNVSERKPNRPDQCCTWNPLAETLKRETGWEWDRDNFLNQHNLDATAMTQFPADRLSYLKSTHRFSATKFARINNPVETAAQQG